MGSLQSIMPLSQDQCLQRTFKVSANLDDLGGDAKKGFVVGGISAGANLVAVISHLYRDDHLSPPLTGIYLSVPAVLSPEVVPAKYKDQYLSREQNKNAPILNQGAIALFRSMSQKLSSPAVLTGVL